MDATKNKNQFPRINSITEYKSAPRHLGNTATGRWVSHCKTPKVLYQYQPMYVRNQNNIDNTDWLFESVMPDDLGRLKSRRADTYLTRTRIHSPQQLAPYLQELKDGTPANRIFKSLRLTYIKNDSQLWKADTPSHSATRLPASSSLTEKNQLGLPIYPAASASEKQRHDCIIAYIDRCNALIFTSASEEFNQFKGHILHSNLPVVCKLILSYYLHSDTYEALYDQQRNALNAMTFEDLKKALTTFLNKQNWDHIKST